ncbi:MAG: uracil-DNA glycosylase family protein [Persicimonas sp.]
MSKRAELYRVVRDLKEYLRWQQAEGAAGSVPARPDERRAFEELAKARQRQKLERLTRAPDDEEGGSGATEETVGAESGAQKEEATPRDGSEAAPWKKLGSRPQRRFSGPPEPASSADTGKGGEPRQAYDDKAYPEAVDPEATRPEAQQASKPDPSEMTKRDKLDYLREYLGDCRRCTLCENRTNIVFGTGAAEARLVFVGEAPGYNEDQQGEPFVGKAGKLLDKMIGAMGLEREEVYICNVIKCRPPKNRDPHADEIRECSPFLRKQLEAIEPEVIVTLGRFAAQFITGTDKPMGALRGRWSAWRDIPVMPTYHPAYLLRSPDQKAKVWSDLQMVMERLGLRGKS